ncbi:MAG: hypothetical protein DMF59_07505 [Acidobacteria bacterium]|nr:MAG: hypothetical protein DMF59_07505 [Acidobacteriota bacterium]
MATAMVFEPLFHFLVGSASVAFTGAALVGYIAHQRSAFFFTTAAGVTAFLFFFHLPETPTQILLICLTTAIAELAAVHGHITHTR